MPTKKYIELQDYTEEQLQSELVQTQSQYQKLRFDHTLKGLENPLVLREVRKDIARLNSEIRRRKIANMSPEELLGRSKIKARRRKK